MKKRLIILVYLLFECLCIYTASQFFCHISTNSGIEKGLIFISYAYLSLPAMIILSLVKPALFSSNYIRFSYWLYTVIIGLCVAATTIDNAPAFVTAVGAAVCIAIAVANIAELWHLRNLLRQA